VVCGPKSGEGWRRKLPETGKISSLECATSLRCFGVEDEARMGKNGERGLDDSFSSNQRREIGVGVLSGWPSGAEAGGLRHVEEKGKEGPRRRL
jgi:hypothetical protein